MRGVKFDDYHSADDWDLILNSKTINPPTPKYVTVEVDGRDGNLDLSEALTGEVKYNNREASFGFILAEGSQSDREDLISTIVNAIHGKRKKIVEPDDPDHYLIGRCTVGEITNTRAYGTLFVSVDCEPYRYALTETVRTITATSTATEVVLTNNGRKTVVPTIVVTGSVSVEFDNTTTTLSDGSYKIASLTLKTGSKILKIKGSGTIVFSYREGVL